MHGSTNVQPCCVEWGKGNNISMSLDGIKMFHNVNGKLEAYNYRLYMHVMNILKILWKHFFTNIYNMYIFVEYNKKTTVLVNINYASQNGSQVPVALFK